MASQGIMIQGLRLDCGELARLFILMVSLLASFLCLAFVTCFYGELAGHCFPW